MLAYQAYYIQVFIEIKDSRGYGFSGEPLPLALSEIAAYCDLYYIESAVERERIVRMVRHLDMAYREVAAKMAKEAAAKPPETDTNPEV